MIVSKRLARGADDLGLLALLGVQVAAQQEAAHPDHGVHRRADLVAHGGQERALGGVRRVGRRARLLRARVQAGVVERDHRKLGKPLEPLDLGGARKIARPSRRAPRRAPRSRRPPTSAGRSPSPRCGCAGTWAFARARRRSPGDDGRLERRHHLPGEALAACDRQVSLLLEHAHRRAGLQLALRTRPACRRSRARRRAARRRGSASRAAGRRCRDGASPRARSRAAPRARRSAPRAPRCDRRRAARGPPVCHAAGRSCR